MAQEYHKQERTLMRWENRVVLARDRSRVGQHVAQSIVSHVWQSLGMPHKGPLVQIFRRDDDGYVPGAMAHMCLEGTVLGMQAEELPTVVILHELAHAVTDDPLLYMERGRIIEREFHGPKWLTNYLWMLNEFMGPLYNTFYLRGTLPPEIQSWPLGYAPVTWRN